MLILLTAIAILSISLFEAVLVLLLIYTAVKGKSWWSGSLIKPLFLHGFVVLFSTLLYHPSQVGKAIERGLFLLVYPIGGRLKVCEKSLYQFNRFLVLVGFLLLPVTVYKFVKTGNPAMVWGGPFEVGALYTIFAIASVSLTLYTRKWVYFIPFVLFMSVVFFSTKRSTMLGLVFSILAIAFFVSRRLSWRVAVSMLLVLFLGAGLSFTFLVHKDPRFITVYEVITGKRPIDEETLNTISSGRWEIAKAGIEVVKNDINKGNFIPLLIGHGINAGFYLEPKSPVGGIYESFFLLSEFIEKGLLGTFAVLWVFYAYFKLLFKFRITDKRDLLLLSLLLPLGAHLVGSVFTFFWDALLPLYLIFFRVVEKVKSELSQQAG